MNPPFGSKRKAAMAIYTPPFVFKHGYVFDSQNHMVADQGGFGGKDTVERAVALQIRGWGRIGYMPNAKELQDEIGAMCVDALNAYYAATKASAQKSGDAHEIWAAAQLAPGEGIEDGVSRVEALLDASRVPMTSFEMETAARSPHTYAIYGGAFKAGIRAAEIHHGIGVKS